jgi:hypothetical protein
MVNYPVPADNVVRIIVLAKRAVPGKNASL